MAIKIIFFDLETNGFRGSNKFSNLHKIIQFAAISKDGKTTFNSYVNPGVAILPKSTQIHHISNEDVKDAPSFKQAWKKFHETFQLEYDEDPVILVAHNCFGFDRLVLLKEMRDNMVTPPSTLFFADTLVYFKYLAPMKLRTDIESKVKGYSKYNLNSLFRYFTGDDIEALHSADADVFALKQISDIAKVDFQNGMPLVSANFYSEKWAYPSIKATSTILDLKGIGKKRFQTICEALYLDDTSIDGFLKKLIDIDYNKMSQIQDVALLKEKLFLIERFLREYVNINDDCYLIEIEANLCKKSPLEIIDIGFPFYIGYTGRFNFNYEQMRSMEFKTIHDLILKCNFDCKMNNYLQQNHSKPLSYYKFLLS